MVNMQATSAIGGLFFLSHLHDGELTFLSVIVRVIFLSHLHDGELARSRQTAKHQLSKPSTRW